MKKCVLWLLLAALLTTLAPSSLAQEPEPIPITTVEELQSIDPAGSYILMEDLNLAGVDWVPLELSGSFDGNGHTILNLTLTQLSQRQGISFDGNWKEYETRFSALFGFVSGNVRNLNLLNVRGFVEAGEPCFLAGLVGCLEGGTVSGCSVTGTLELRAFDRCFGVGGVVGHGTGLIENCTADVTLICTDTQPEADEQFLGGIYAAGFIDVKGCTVKIDGYASEHGYAHNGGIVGLCVRYPRSSWEPATLINNHVTGRISFFEEVVSRRAYCRAIYGETLVRKLIDSGNTHDFVRDERKDYTTELRPDMCENPVYQEKLIAGLCPEFGHSEFTCQSCGYTYKDRYLLPQHSPDQWRVVTQPTREAEGLAEAACLTCGKVLQQVLPVDDTPTEPPTTVPTVPETTQTEPTVPAAPAPVQPDREPVDWILPAVLGGCVLLGLLLLLIRPRKKGKYQAP